MSPLAQYFHDNHLSPVRQHRVSPEPFKIEFKSIPVITLTRIKVFCLLGIVLATFLPPQYAWAVIAVTNGYWMFKL